jgi:hypothetical protein
MQFIDRLLFAIVLLSIGCNSNSNQYSIFAVTTSGDPNVSVAPSSAQLVVADQTQSVTVTANPGYMVSTTILRSCPIGSWNGSNYTTRPISSNCSLSFAGFKGTPVNTVFVSSDSNTTVSPNK